VQERGDSLDLSHVADLWEENQEYLKQQLGESDSSRLGAHWVLMPDAPFPRFNHVSRVRLDEQSVPLLLDEARAFYRGHGLPTSCLMVTPATTPPDLASRLYRMGFTVEYNPVMLWDGTPIQPDNPWLRVTQASAEQAGHVLDLIRRVFFPGATDRTLGMARRGVAVSYRIGAINYIAWWGSRPAGAGMLFCRGDMAGIYNMCTLPEFRGRGVATAVLAACIQDAQRLGVRYVGLTPTVMGRPLYERLGFREIYQEQYFVERL